MIRGDPRCDIGGEFLAAESWGMAIHPFAVGHLDLFQYLGVCMDHPRKVHHLPEPLYPFLFHEVFKVLCPDLGPCGLQCGGWYT